MTDVYRVQKEDGTFNNIVASDAFVEEHYKVREHVRTLKPRKQSAEITKAAYRNRFTRAEKMAIESLATTDIEVKVAWEDQMSMLTIDLASDDTTAALDLYELKTLITSERRSEIQTAKIKNSERP